MILSQAKAIESPQAIFQGFSSNVMAKMEFSWSNDLAVKYKWLSSMVAAALEAAVRRAAL